MCLVLELEQPLLLLSVHIHIYEYAAGIVLLADFHIVEPSGAAEISRAYGGEFHQTEALAFPSEFLAHRVELSEFILELSLHEGVVHPDGVEFGAEGGVTAMVAPVGVEYPEFGLGRLALFGGEILHHLAQVRRAHRQTPLFAESGIFLLLQGCKAFEYAYRFNFGLLVEFEPGEVLFTGLHCVDVIMAD